MKLFRSLIAPLLMALLLTGCSISDLYEVEPSHWDKKAFERSITASVKKAVHAPGIDNGSTIVVTSDGDTLIAPVDTTLQASRIRTVYVEIPAPEYPHRISTRAIEIFTILSVISFVGGGILLILFGVFVIVIRRQHSRNKAINHAIDEYYELPEAFFTGSPAAPPVTINHINTTASPASSATPTSAPGGPDVPPEAPSGIPGSGPYQQPQSVVDSIRNFTSSVPDSKAKDLRQGLILAGFAIVLFFGISSAARDFAPGFLVGGSLMVFALAKLLPLYFGKRN